MPEGALLGGCRAGDDQAWAELFAKCIPLARRRALRLGFPDADANDISQEVMMSLARDIQTVENPLAYVQTVTYRRCIDRIRRKRPEQPIDEILSESENGGNPGPDKSVVRIWIEQWIDQTRSENQAQARFEALDLLRKQLAMLGEPCHGLLKSRFHAQRTYKELAKDRHIPEAQVGVYIARCVTRLKTLIQSDKNAWKTLVDLWMEIK